MELPRSVFACLKRIEDAGFPCYAVGGCVRDWLLGKACSDYDLCTAATPAQIKTLFSDRDLVLAGEKHGTVGIITDSGVVEITTFRTEGGYVDNRHPDWVRFVQRIEDDLSRRDFTVNAMAWSPFRGLCDPFRGQLDLKNRVLRCVGDPETRFREDALRILRGVRFAVRFGLTPDAATLSAMNTLSPLMEHLARERVYSELSKLLTGITADQLLSFRVPVTQPIPELAATVGFDQHSPHHAYDVYTHTAHVTASVPGKPALRWAALLHDIGKVPTFRADENGRGHFYGHAEKSAEMADAILLRLKAPTALRQTVTELIRMHMTPLPQEKKALRRWVGRYGREMLEDLLCLQEADMLGKGVDDPMDLAQFPRIRSLLAEIEVENSALTVRDLAVNGGDLMALGYQGKQIGAALEQLLELVLDETIPNEKQALLAALTENHKNQ